MGKGLEEGLQRRNTNVQQAYINMFDIIGHYGN